MLSAGTLIILAVLILLIMVLIYQLATEMMTKLRNAQVALREMLTVFKVTQYLQVKDKKIEKEDEPEIEELLNNNNIEYLPAYHRLNLKAAVKMTTND